MAPYPHPASLPHDLDFTGFAQEFLRRNPRYRAAYEHIIQADDGLPQIVKLEEMARLWGLAFSGAAGSDCMDGARELVAVMGAGNDRRRGGARYFGRWLADAAVPTPNIERSSSH